MMEVKMAMTTQTPVGPQDMSEGSPAEEALDRTGEDVLDAKVDKRNIKYLGPKPRTVKHSTVKGKRFTG